MNPLNYERIHTAVDAQLAAKGYRLAENGQFSVAFTVGSREKIHVNDFGYYGGYYGYYRHGGTSVDQYTEGTLAIDVFDSTTHRPVWRTVATQRIDETGATADQVNEVVAAALQSFPTHGAPPAS